VALKEVRYVAVYRAAATREKRVAKRVPKGTSDYQAAWILESDREEVCVSIMKYVCECTYVLLGGRQWF